MVRSSGERRIPKKIIEEVKVLLDEGRKLPDEFKPVLFESKREYELTYAGKEREADILAETMAVPLQPVKTFGAPEDGWSNMLIFGDNLQVLKTLLTIKQSGGLACADGTPGVRLIYIDPPFATQQEFRGARDERAYQDKVIGAGFLEFLRKRLIFLRELLTDDGSIYVHLDTRKVHYVKALMDEIFGEHNFRNEIIWKRTTSHSDAKKFGAVHETILYYSRNSEVTFQPPLVALDPDYVTNYYRYKDRKGERFMSADLTAKGPGPPRQFGDRGELFPPPGRHWAYDQRGIDELLSKDLIFWTREGIPRRKIYLRDAKGTPPTDVWIDQLPVVSWSREATGYPTQKPEGLLSRIIETSSQPGDLVLDAFLGSGTSSIVCERLNRRWIGIDCGKLAIYTTQTRLLRLGADKKTLLSTRAFTLHNAGLYDYRLLRDLAWEEFRGFALRLFQCRDESHIVGKVQLDGYLSLDHVLVFDFQKHKGAVLDETYVEDLHEALQERIGRRFFVIAPAASVKFFQDFIELEGPDHPIRYFVLRIPYSVIEEIHERGFTRLQQPIAESDVNDTVDAIGFDFIQPPTVSCRYSKTASELKVKIRNFETEAITRDVDGPKGFESLAMVMVDHDYDGSVFDLDEVFYADELAKNDYAFNIPGNRVGNQIMLIYIDVYGNEYREVLKPKDFTPSKKG